MLKPQKKYTDNFHDEVEKFFNGGGYQLLQQMESNFTNCASICKKPLFYLTKDVSYGKPGKECIRAALDWAETSAKALGFFTGLNGAVIIIGSFLTIPLAISQEDLVEDEESFEEDNPENIEFDQAIKLKSEDLGAPPSSKSGEESQNKLINDEDKKNNSKFSIHEGEFDNAVGLEESKENLQPPPPVEEEN